MPRTPSILENEHARAIGGLLAVVSILVVFGGMSAFTAAYMLILIGGVAVADWLVDARNLPDETSQGVYGALVVAAAGFVALTSPGGMSGQGSMPAVVVVGLLAGVGAWTVLDAYTKARDGDDTETHAFVRGADDDGTEAMLRMQTMNAVNRELKNADGPRTPSELADTLDLTSARVEPALSYLASKGHAEHVDGGYRATPPRWGRLHPVVAFARWLPRRLLAPVRRLRA